MNLTEIRAVVRDYINNATTDVDQHVVDAVNFLSNFFYVTKIDTSEVTVNAQSWIAPAADFLKLRILVIDGVYINDLLSDNYRKDIADSETQLWFIADNKIQLTAPMSNAGKAIKMIYDAKFIQPELAVDTDVPDRLLEFIYVGATYRYFDKLATLVATDRSSYPNVSPKEIEKMRKQWKDRFDTLLVDLL